MHMENQLTYAVEKYKKYNFSRISPEIILKH